MIAWLRRLFSGPETPEPKPPLQLRAVLDDGSPVYAEPCGCRLVVDADKSFATGEFRGCGGSDEHCDDVYDRLMKRALMETLFAEEE